MSDSTREQTETQKIHDLCIIGLGICGAATAYTLARYELEVLVLEAENDASTWTTKANSAILHAGYDPEPGSLMAETNREGVILAKQICADLDIPRHEIGSLVLAFDDADVAHIKALYERGKTNGIPGLQILNAEETLQKEPQLNPQVKASLYAPSAAVVDPWEYALAMTETAIKNGVSVKTDARVANIRYEKQIYTLTTESGQVFKARAIVNAAGVHADEIHALAGGSGFTIQPSRGQYYMLDKSAGTTVHHVIFQCPNLDGKGVLVSPTVHGNLIVGPNAESGNTKEDTATTAEGQAFVRDKALKSVPAIPWSESIRNFAGLRANSNINDFIFGFSEQAPAFINMAGIKSPGLTSAPALAARVPALLEQLGFELKEKTHFLNERKRLRFRFLSAEEKRVKCEENPLYARIICRCEGVTEAEIREVLESPFPPRSVEAVKRRCNAGMGRCQGGFCGPRIRKLLAEYRLTGPENIPLDRAGSQELLGQVKPERIEEIHAAREQSQKKAASSAKQNNLEARTAAVTNKENTLDPRTQEWDIVIVGAGPAGMSAAFAAKKENPQAKILLLERDTVLGGILNQCIHSGFGLHYFKEELTGPEYAERCLKRLEEQEISLLCDAMVLGINGQMTTLDEAGQTRLHTHLQEHEGSALHLVSAITPAFGYMEMRTKSLILAMGCRERPRGGIGIPGSRPAGVMTAGTAQRYMNIENLLPGKRVVILGSGDIGLIMARRLSLEGSQVLACVELLPYSSGLTRNRVQCLDDFGIPLLLSHTVTKISGYPRLESVEVSQVDENRRPIPGTEQRFACDCLLLSVGLIPENELSRCLGLELDPRTRGCYVDESLQTEVPGVFACGNVLHVHDLVDYVSAESERAGRAAIRYAMSLHQAARATSSETAQEGIEAKRLRFDNGTGISYVVPQSIRPQLVPTDGVLYYRVNAVYPRARIELCHGDDVLASWNKTFLAPGEMQAINLSPSLLNKMRQSAAESLELRLIDTQSGSAGFMQSGVVGQVAGQ